MKDDMNRNPNDRKQDRKKGETRMDGVWFPSIIQKEKNKTDISNTKNS